METYDETFQMANFYLLEVSLAHSDVSLEVMLPTYRALIFHFHLDGERNHGKMERRVGEIQVYIFLLPLAV